MAKGSGTLKGLADIFGNLAQQSAASYSGLQPKMKDTRRGADPFKPHTTKQATLNPNDNTE
jgi:hypothetical protein